MPMPPLYWNVTPHVGVGPFLFGQRLKDCRQRHPSLRIDEEPIDTPGITGWFLPSHPENKIYFRRGRLFLISCSEACTLEDRPLTGISFALVSRGIKPSFDEVEDFDRMGEPMQIYYYWHLGLTFFVDACHVVETVFCYAWNRDGSLPVPALA